MTFICLPTSSIGYVQVIVTSSNVCCLIDWCVSTCQRVTMWLSMNSRLNFWLRDTFRVLVRGFWYRVQMFLYVILSGEPISFSSILTPFKTINKMQQHTVLCICTVALKPCMPMNWIELSLYTVQWDLKSISIKVHIYLAQYKRLQNKYNTIQ